MRRKHTLADNGRLGDELTPAHRRAIAALLTERDIRSAAKAAGVGERTLYTWLDDSAFRRELKAAESQAIDQAVRRLSELSGTAIDTLKAAMKNRRAATSARVRAADIVLSRLLNLKELHDLESRIAALEEARGGDDEENDRWQG